MVRDPLTKTLNPVTEAKEEAKEAPESASSPRWPTYMTDVICKLYCSKLTAIRGPASHSCFFASSITSPLQNPSWDVSASNSWFLCWFGIRGVSTLELTTSAILRKRASLALIAFVYCLITWGQLMRWGKSIIRKQVQWQIIRQHI